MKKKIKAKITDTKGYIGVLNGMFNLTDKEMEVLAAFIDKEKELRHVKVDPFSSAVKKMIATSLGIEDHNTLNVYIKRLKDKNVIRQSGNTYQIAGVLKRYENEESVEIIWQTSDKS